MGKKFLRLTKKEKDALSAQLAWFKGRKLNYMRRAFGWQYFYFGDLAPTRPGGRRRAASLSVECDWSIMKGCEFNLNSGDFGPFSARRDNHAKWFYALMNEGILVEGVSVLENGNFSFRLAGGFVLDVLPGTTPAGSCDPDMVYIYGDPYVIVITTEGLRKKNM